MDTPDSASPRFHHALWQNPPIESSLPRRLVQPKSWVGHLPFAFWIVGALQPLRIVELGVHTGNSYSSFCQAVDMLALDTKCAGVDHWHGDPQAGFYGDEILAELKAHHDPRYGKFSTLMRMSFEDAVGHFSDGSVDLLHIDGFHTYEAVTSDLAAWRNKLSSRSIVLFHDTNVYEREFGVWKLMEELKRERPLFNFLHSNGLGVAYFGTDPLPPALKPFFESAEVKAKAEVVRRYFSNLGSNLLSRLERAEAYDRVGVLSQAALAEQGLSVQDEKSTLPAEETTKELAQPAKALTGFSKRAVGRAAAALQRLSGASAHRQKINTSGYFNEDYYRSLAPSAKSARDALSHYIVEGEKAGLRPSKRFDPSYYARRYPDIAKSDIGLLEHYVSYGQKEGRHPLPPSERLDLPAIAPESDRERFLVVLPDLDWVGYGLLALDMLNRASEREIYLISMKEGPLRAHLEPLVDQVMTVDALPCTDWEADDVAQLIISKIEPDWVVLFGAATYQFTAAFASQEQAVVTVLDEYDQDDQNYKALDVIGHWSGALVFHSPATAKRVETTCPNLSAIKRHLIPPVIEKFPPLPPQLHDTACDAVRSWLRPDSTDNPLVVALDGTDASPEFLAELVRLLGAAGLERKVRMAWIGSEPLLDHTLEVLSANDQNEVEFVDQDLRPYWQIAGQLVDLCVALDATPQIYHRCLKLMVSGQTICVPQEPGSPLSWAMETGVPRVFSYQQGDAASVCSTVLATLRKSPETEEAIRGSLKELETVYGPSRYQQSLSKVSREATDRSFRLSRYAQVISASNLFDPIFYRGVELELSEDAAIRHFCSAASNVDLDRYQQYFLRRPFPGFNPLVYAEETAQKTGAVPENPLVHYIEQGRPEGAWHNKLLVPGQQETAPRGLRVAVHGHFHYPDLFGSFLERFGDTLDRYHFHVTVTRPEAIASIEQQADAYGVKRIEIIECPNIGRDVGPFLTVLEQIQSQGFDIVGHFHGKKSKHLTSSHADRWRDFLWEHLIGGTAPMAQMILGTFEQDVSLGLVFPEDPLVLGWGDNKSFRSDLARRAGLTTPLPEFFDFPVGNTFWARPQALQGLLDMKLTHADFPNEPIGSDGTILHALERILPLLVREKGYSIATTHVPGIVR